MIEFKTIPNIIQNSSIDTQMDVTLAASCYGIMSFLGKCWTAWTSLQRLRLVGVVEASRAVENTSVRREYLFLLQ
jgi:hypothetical protein